MKLHKIEALKNKVAAELSKNYNAELSSFYFNHLMEKDDNELLALPGVHKAESTRTP